MAEIRTSLSQWSVRTLLIWLVLASLLPGVIGAAILFSYQYQEGRTRQERDALQTARALMHAIDSHLLRVEAAGEALATSDALDQGNLARFYERAQRLIDRFELAGNVVLRDKNEQLVLNASKPFGEPLPVQPSREHVRRVFATGKPALSDLYYVPQFEHPIVSLDVPVFIRGEVAYSLGITVFPEQINELLRSQNLPLDWLAVVVDSDGTVVGRNMNPEKFIGKGSPAPFLQAWSQSREGMIEATSLEGTPLRAAYSRSVLTDWAVVIGIPSASLQEALMRSLIQLAVGVAALFAIGLILAWFMGGRIARSVSALTAPAMALGRGEPVQAPPVQVKEAAEVGAALGHAAELLQKRTAALQVREADLAQAHTRLRDVIDSSPALIYLKDLQGHFLLVNKAYEKMIGTDRSKIKIANENLRLAPLEQGPSAADLQVLQSGGIIQFEEEIDTAEGLKYFTVSKAPLRNHEGQIIGICAAAVDVTSLKTAEAKVRGLAATLEKRVEQRTEELSVANNQLEAFSYTVAHDLRAPLRGIQGFADALMEDYEGQQLDETGQDYLLRIAKAAGRMEQLIDDLLSFSRLSRMGFALGAVNLEEVLRQALTNLNAQIKESHAHVEMTGELPAVWANNTACLHIFQNLVANAIKFSKPDTEAHVRIWSELRVVEQTTRKVVRVWIEDNGIGVPPAQRQRIFKPFERLHGVSEYPGSGIGLAIVDMATRRMQGRCGVESEVNVGSRFWIELPALKVEE